jgi:hypothetical protein
MPSLKPQSSKDVQIRKAAPADTPLSLTHYTDLAGFQGIVENNELWLSNAAFLNDPEELEHGIRQARKILEKLLEGSASDRTARARLKLVADIVKDFKKFRPPSIFIICFCEKRDLLSQWRGYASRQGVSVSFDTEKLRSSFNHIDLAGSNIRPELQQIAYGINDTKSALRDAIREELPDIVDDVDYMLGSEKDEDIRRKFGELMSTLIPRFKHLGFREEREWRLLLRDPPDSQITFRPRGQLMLPYVKLKAGTHKMPITRVTVGPGVNDSAVLNSIQFFLEKKGYRSDLAYTSSIPYRT